MAYVKDKKVRFLLHLTSLLTVVISHLTSWRKNCSGDRVSVCRTVDACRADRLSELQGIHTATEIHNFLAARKRIDGYPLFDNVYRISWEGLPVEKLTEGLSGSRKGRL